jgi:hypothetical protein
MFLFLVSQEKGIGIPILVQVAMGHWEVLEDGQVFQRQVQATQ